MSLLFVIPTLNKFTTVLSSLKTNQSAKGTEIKQCFLKNNSVEVVKYVAYEAKPLKWLNFASKLNQ